MKKHIFAFLLAFLLAAAGTQAQSLHFCSNYSDNGEPIGISNSWNLGQNGGYVYLLYNNGKKNIKSKVLLINIAKQNGNDYTEYDTKVFDVQDKKNWAIYDYNFKEAGNYRVTVFDNNKNELAKGFVAISLKKDASGKDTYVEKDDKGKDKNDKGNDKKDYPRVDDNYYNAKMTFCTAIEDGKPKNEDEAFTINKSGGYIYVYVMNDKPLKTSGVRLVVLRNSGYEYSEEITNENYTINGDIPGTYIQYTFYKTGDFKVVLYNKDDIKISSGYVTISQNE